MKRSSSCDWSSRIVKQTKMVAVLLKPSLTFRLPLKQVIILLYRSLYMEKQYKAVYKIITVHLAFLILVVFIRNMINEKYIPLLFCRRIRSVAKASVPTVREACWACTAIRKQREKVFRSGTSTPILLSPIKKSWILLIFEHFQPELIEIEVELGRSLKLIQAALLDLLRSCMKELKQCCPQV